MDTTMNLLELPRELLILVLEYLDTPSLYAVYRSCSQLKCLITDFNIVKKCSFSLNTMSSASSLKLSFFKNIIGNLQVLDLSGVPNLTKTSVLPAMKKLVNLRTLNIQFTGLNLMDFVEIHKMCPTIKNISINMEFGNVDKYPARHPLNNTIIPDVVIEICQETFQSIENVHFYTTGEIALFTDLPHAILSKCGQLNDVNITAWRNDSDYMLVHDKRVAKPLKYKQWFVHVAECFHALSHTVLTHLDTDLEFIIMSNADTSSKHFVSTGLKEFCEKNLTICYESATEFPYGSSISGTIDILKWDKASNKFDDVFFCKLLKQLKRILPASVFKYDVAERNCWDMQTITQDKISNLMLSVHIQQNYLQFKRQRVAPGSYTLDFEQYKQIELLRLQVTFKNVVTPITLSPTADYLQKLVHLTLIGSVQYSGNFFHTLFSTCDRLTTLHVISNTPGRCSQLISSSVKLSFSLKNLRLVERDINKQFLPGLSKCKSIEIVFLQDDSDGESKPGINLLLKCASLHILYMAHSKMSDACKKREMKYIEMLKTKCVRQSVKIVLNSSSDFDYPRREGLYKILHGNRKFTIIKGLRNAFLFQSMFPFAKESEIDQW